MPAKKKVKKDDSLMIMIRAADKAYDSDGVVMSYFEEPDEDWGDTLAKFIVLELKDTFDSKEGLQKNLDAAASQMYRAASQLTAVAHALAHNPVEG